MAMETERAALCLSGLDTEDFLARALRRLPAPAWRFALIYVIDTRPAEELGYLRQALFRGRLPPDRLAQMTTAEDETAREVLAEARADLQRSRPAAEVIIHLARGRPEQEIIRAAHDLRADLLVVGARFRGGPRPASGPPSVGHVARFVLDHAPCDVLLLR
jgi:nucleotide-binding universal stress UspA family protein